MNKGVLVAIGLLLGLVAGTGIGFWLAGAPIPDGQGSAVDVPEPELQIGSHREQPDQVDTVLPYSTPSRERTLADIIADADIPAIPSGTARLTGSVLSVEGRPLAGVEVAASSNYPEPRRYSGLLPIERVQQEIRISKWNELSRRVTRSNDNGQYVIDGLAEDTDYTATATSPGWKIEPGRDGPRWFKPPAEINFVARAEVEVGVEAEHPALLLEALPGARVGVVEQGLE